MSKDELPKPRYMTIQEVADELKINYRTAYSKVISGEIAGVDVGGGKIRSSWRVLRSSFEDYCARIEREAERRLQWPPAGSASFGGQSSRRGRSNR